MILWGETEFFDRVYLLITYCRNSFYFNVVDLLVIERLLLCSDEVYIFVRITSGKIFFNEIAFR